MMKIATCCTTFLLIVAVSMLTPASASTTSSSNAPRFLQALPPDNDSCETPTLLDLPTDGSLFQLSSTTLGATADSIACLGDVRTGVYYQFTSSEFGARYQVSTCHPATDYNTSIYVEENSDACSSVGCTPYQSAHDDDGDCTVDGVVAKNGFAATVELFTEPSTTYTIFVAGVDATSVGNFGLTVQEYVVPDNDQCSGAMLLEPSHTDPTIPVVIGSTANATATVLSCESVELPTVYYQFEGTGARFLVSTCTAQTDFDATFVVGESTCEDIGCVQINERVNIDCDQQFGQAVEFRTEENVTYTIAVRGLTPEDTGMIGLVVYEYLRPSNDDCLTPQSVEFDSEAMSAAVCSSTENATLSFFDCLAEAYPTVYFSVVGTGGTIIASTCFDDGLNFNSLIIVNEGGGCDGGRANGCGSLFSEADLECDSSGLAATVEWEAEVGVEYLLAVKGVSPKDKGIFRLLLQSNELKEPTSGAARYGTRILLGLVAAIFVL